MYAKFTTNVIDITSRFCYGFYEKRWKRSRSSSEMTEITVNEPRDFAMLYEDSNRRRFWLLFKALECDRLDRALELARMCDDFVTGATGEPLVAVALRGPESSVASLEQGDEERAATSA